jgi:hypothetical protein
MAIEARECFSGALANNPAALVLAAVLVIGGVIAAIKYKIFKK